MGVEGHGADSCMGGWQEKGSAGKADVGGIRAYSLSPVKQQLRQLLASESIRQVGTTPSGAGPAVGVHMAGVVLFCCAQRMQQLWLHKSFGAVGAGAVVGTQPHVCSLPCVVVLWARLSEGSVKQAQARVRSAQRGCCWVCRGSSHRCACVCCCRHGLTYHMGCAGGVGLDQVLIVISRGMAYS